MFKEGWNTYENIRSPKIFEHGLDGNGVCDIGGDVGEFSVWIAITKF